MRFDVLIREGMHKEATSILIAAARDHPQAAHESLRKGLEGLGQTVITDAVNQPGGVSTCLLVSLSPCVCARMLALSRPAGFRPCMLILTIVCDCVCCCRFMRTGLLDHLVPWLEQWISGSETIDSAAEVLD